jgi:hypothetical protein
MLAEKGTDAYSGESRCAQAAAHRSVQTGGLPTSSGASSDSSRVAAPRLLAPQCLDDSYIQEIGERLLVSGVAQRLDLLHRRIGARGAARL